jgi:hypothetical protein
MRFAISGIRYSICGTLHIKRTYILKEPEQAGFGIVCLNRGIRQPAKAAGRRGLGWLNRGIRQPAKAAGRRGGLARVVVWFFQQICSAVIKTCNNGQ